MEIEISQLKAFERAAREGNFTRAAEAMQLSQPAVSTRIASLEAQLGGQLFERRGRQLQLTALGRHFLPYAERILAMLADSIEAVQSYHSGKVGEVKIAAASPFVVSFLPEVLEDFRHSHPSIDVHILQRLKSMIIEMLYDGVVSLGMVYSPVFDHNLVELAHFQEPVRGVVAPQHPLAALQAAQGSLLMHHLYDHTIFRTTMFPRMTAFIDTVVEHGRRGSGGAVLAVPMIMVVRLLILGQGVAFLPESYVERHVEAGRLCFLQIEDMPPLLSEPTLLALKGRALDEAHREFIRIMKTRWAHMLVQPAVQ